MNDIKEMARKIELKGGKLYLVGGNEELDKYIENIFIEVKNKIELLPKEKEKNWDLLNEKFKKIIEIK